MNQITDIRPLKAQLRSESKEYRRNLAQSEKERFDKKIQNKFLNQKMRSSPVPSFGHRRCEDIFDCKGRGSRVRCQLTGNIDLSRGAAVKYLRKFTMRPLLHWEAVSYV